MDERLAFVVICPTPPDDTVLDDRFKGFSTPFVKRLYGHHVVVPVDEHGGFFTIDNFFTVDNGIAFCGHNLCLIGPCGENGVFPVFGGLYHVGLMFRLSAY